MSASPTRSGTPPGSPSAAKIAAAAAAAATARLPAPEPVSAEAAHAEAKFVAARKAMVRIIQWELNDDKHRALEQILDTTQYLLKICGNVKNSPDESKFRRIRITNPTFARHVRDASGGEQFMRAAGWVLQVHDFEKHFAFEHQPGQWEWRVLEAACVELEKLIALLQGKIQRGMGDKKAAQEKMRQQVRAALEDDKAQREARYEAEPRIGLSKAGGAIAAVDQ
ncbi:hypothetical protein D9Q98_000342 [Chlorella vulgaris]|uniref:PUB domain-containing protein n=1 Tax=Chlorella vulgaris TaxID=3077 RepID=A0A9D4TY60_CHLVU|nr:hypothetical protein D9Q98_000342 [Chlorella vulgaris]